MIQQPAAAAAFVLVLAASACSRSPDTAGPEPKMLATGTFHDAAGARTGVATLTDTAGMLRLDLSAGQLSPGPHGLHFHAVGVCTPPDFKSAGAHFNPEGKQHGRLNPEGPHLGDLPNIHAGLAGTVDTSLTLSRDLIASGPRALFSRRIPRRAGPRFSSTPGPMTSGRTRVATPATGWPAPCSSRR